MRFGFLSLAVAVLLITGTANAETVLFNFSAANSSNLDGSGIGGFQSATATDGTVVTLTTTDITGYIDDGAGGFSLEALSDNADAGHTVSLRTQSGGQVGVGSAAAAGFTSASGHFNPGETWTFVFDEDVRFDSLDLQSYDDPSENNQFTISAGGTNLVFNEDTFPDDQPDINFTEFNGGTEFIVAAGTEITFAASSFDPTEPFNASSDFRIPDFQLTVLTAVPEPSSLVLLGLLGGVAAVRRRR